MRHNSIKSILCCVLLTTGCALAVTEQEIQNIQEAMPGRPITEPAQQRTMLVFSLCKGYQHSSIPYWMKALDIMSEKTGAFKVVHSTDMNVFTPESLKQFDAICFNNTTQLVPDENQQKAIMDFIKSGKSIVGIHAATDNFYDWPEGMEMMGGVFKGHPWGGGGTWAIKIDDPDHPLMKSFKGEGFKIKDEIYRTAAPLYSRRKQRVLMSLDMSDPVTRNAEGVVPDDMDTGISWIKRVGNGRLFYCSLGHDHAVTWNTAVLAHYLAGIQYALGDLKVDDTPLDTAGSGLDVSKLNALIEQVSRYEWDSDRADALALEALVRSNYGDSAALGQIEDKLLAALQSNVTMTGRDFICRQLAVIGTDKSVPVLSAMLVNPQMSSLARYALERIPGQAADQALVNTAQKTDNSDVLIGIITSLGVRKSESVVPLSQQRLTDATPSDPAVQEAFVQSLGTVGTQAAAGELERIRPQMTGAALERWPDALLMCAGAMLDAGQPSQAIAIYQKLYKPESSSIVKASAIRALAKLDAANSESLLKQAIESPDAVLQSAAMQALPAMSNNTAFLQGIASSTDNLSKDAQIQLVAVMSHVSKDTGRSLAVALLDSDDESVRMAAYQAIEQVGDSSVVERLARGAAQAQNRPERQAAQDALYRMSGEAVDRAILQKIADYKALQLDENAIAELIKAAVNRQITQAAEVLFRTADSDSRKISDESISAIQSLVGPEYMEELVGLLISRPAANTEKAVILAAEKIPDRKNRAAILLDQYPKMAGNEKTQVSMLSVMGKLGDPHAVLLLKKEFNSSNPVIRQAAFRAMTDWPGVDFMEDMKTLAQIDPDAKSRILALRAYIRMVRSSAADRNPNQTVEKLIDAFSMADRPDEQKVVISALGEYNNVQSLDFVSRQLSQPSLAAESEISALQISEKLLTRNPSAVLPVLQKIAKDGSSESARNKAGELLNKVGGLESFVLDWQVSGPYMEGEKSGEVLFDVAFDPEKSLDAGQWKDAQPLLTLDTPPILDLSGLGKGNNRVAYLKTVVSVDETVTSVLHIGSDDGVKVWVNGKQVHANNVTRPVVPGQDKVNMTLEKGPNPVLVKVIQLAGNWGFCMQITDRNGNPISGLHVDAEN